MPFDDNRHPVPGDALEKIDKVIALLATEAKWCKFFAESSDGRRCLWGAMRAEDAASLLEPPILDAIRQVTGRLHRCIDAFNDHPATTHALVLRVLHQARRNMRTAAPHPALSTGGSRRECRGLLWVGPFSAKTAACGLSSVLSTRIAMPRAVDPGKGPEHDEILSETASHLRRL